MQHPWVFGLVLQTLLLGHQKDTEVGTPWGGSDPRCPSHRGGTAGAMEPPARPTLGSGEEGEWQLQVSPPFPRAFPWLV